MNRKQKSKLMVVSMVIVLLAITAGLILYALKQNINLFYTPSEVQTAHLKPDQSIRLGGYVKKQSVHYDSAGNGVTFIMMDAQQEMQIEYHGVLPNLFREGQGVVVTGKLTSPTTFKASEVLAKHDEKYVPKYLLKPGDSKS